MTGVILIDGGYFRASWRFHHASRNLSGKRQPHVPSVTIVTKVVDSIQEEVELSLTADAGTLRWLRTYFYDTDPFEETLVRPDGVRIDFGTNQDANFQRRLLGDLRITEKMAVRKGVLRFRAWETNVGGFKPIFQQKGVDMKIGLDIAWLSSKRIADVVVLVTSDTDFVAPMKLARREGVTICLCALDSGPLSPDLLEHADIVVRVSTGNDGDVQ